jgi:hypothetical protein
VMTLRAVDEEGGSGVAETEWALTGAQVASEIVAGDTSEVLVSAEGITGATFLARDQSGNAGATTSLDIRIDTTPPEAAATTDVLANAEGWSNSNVTVSFAATDVLSGIDTVSEPIVVTAEGANQEIAGNAADLAGNTSSATAHVSIDKTPPVLSATFSTPPNSRGWHKVNVLVTFVASDALSGVATVSEPMLVTTEGAMQPVTGYATDRAGNVASRTIFVSLDKTPPEASIQFDSAKRKPAAIGTDSLSGVHTVTVTDRAKRRQSFRAYRIEDVAGNTLLITLQISDKHHHSNVTIQSLVYNGTASRPRAHSARFSWIDKRGALEHLDQFVEVKGAAVNGVFMRAKNSTIVKTWDAGGKRTETHQGLALVRLVTASGGLRIEVP